MKCPECSFDNPENIKFCGECGNKLDKMCPGCDSPNPTHFKFCGECGSDLKLRQGQIKDLSFDEKIDKIQRYLPKGLTNKILSQRGKIEGERKQVSVLFCDLEGFTQLVERLGPEDAYLMMDHIYEILIHKVHDYEGTINEMTGDGVMALFGAPIAIEDAPQRSIRSAMSIHKELAKYAAEQLQDTMDLPELKMRIGIHTGPVVVGTLGNNLRVEFKAVGDTVNLASRIESLAEPGTTCVSEDTYKFTEGFFRYEALGRKILKGVKSDVGVYRVISPRSKRSRFDVSAEQGLTKFVGRQRELELLIDGFERSKRGLGNAFSIVSEAGLGKSRLLYEFRKFVTNEDITFLEGKCLSFSRNTAYFPIVDLLKATFEIAESDTDIVTIGKVKEALRFLEVNEEAVLVYVLELLSVKDSGFDSTTMSPESKKDRTLDALKLITLKLSEKRPIVIASEDLHWVDKDSEECIEYLLDSVSGARIFLIFTYRPEFVASWGSRSYHSQINLNRLSNRESLIMVKHIFDTVEIESDLEELILVKTEGIPFFIEEFTKSLKDLKAIAKIGNEYHLNKGNHNLIIPSTVQDMIMARVDTLPDNAKYVLQSGSVIEREFSYTLINRICGLTEHELLTCLSVLKEAELIYERGIFPELSFVFKHALTREVVYDSLLVAQRKRLHDKIGKLIEAIYKDNIYDYYGILSHHFMESDNYVQGANYTWLACDRAKNKTAFREAISYARKSVYCLEKLPKSIENQKKIIDTRTALATILLNISQFVEAKEAVTPVVDLSLRLNYEAKLPRIYAVIGTYYNLVEEDFPKGYHYLKEATNLSMVVSDYVSLYFASLFLGWSFAWNCEFDKSSESFNRCLELSIASNNLIGISFSKGIKGAFNTTFQGKIGLAYNSSKEVLKTAQESGDIFIKGLAFTLYGISCYFKGILKEAKESLIKGAAYSDKTAQIGWWCWANLSLGDTYAAMGEYKEAHLYLNKCVTVLDDLDILKSWKNLTMLSLLRVKMKSEGANIRYDELVQFYERNNYKLLEGWTARYIAEILLELDDHHLNEAEKWIKKAIKANSENECIGLYGLDYALYAEILKKKGDYQKVKEYLNIAIDKFRKCDADGWVKKYEKVIEKL